MTSSRERYCVRATLFFTLASLSSCDGPTPTALEYDPAFIEVSATDLRLDALGDTVRLTADVLTQSGRVMAAASVRWQSREPSIVSVSAGGLVQALGPGEATVTATSGAVSATARVMVVQSVASVALSPPMLVLTGLSDTTRLHAAAQDARGNTIRDPRLSWSSRDGTIATVDQGGLITAVAAGETRIAAAGVDADGDSIAASVPLVVAVASGVTVAPDTTDLYVIGHTVQLRATVYGPVGDSLLFAPVTWISSDTTLARVSPAGVVTAVSAGTARVQASSGPASAFALVRVAPRTLAIDPDSTHLPWPLLTRRLNVAVRDELNGALVDPTQPIRWASSDTTVATVDSAGVVTAIRKGSVEITASAGGAEGRATVTAADPDRDALVAFYHATGGEDWTRNDNWLTNQPIWQPPGWYGVVPQIGAGATLAESELRELLSGRAADSDSTPMAILRARMSESWTSWSETEPLSPSELREAAANSIAASRVDALSLPWNELSGVLETEAVPWDSLPFLGFMDLHGNGLTGALPSRLSRNLQLLDLADNSLSGAISTGLSKNQSLLYLDVSNNKLSGEVQGRLRKLLVLRLGHNELSGTIDDIYALAPELLIATWYDNDGLCLDKYLYPWERLLLRGPLCDDSPTGPSEIFTSPRHLRFSSIGDSARVEANVLDLYGWQLDPKRFPPALAGNKEIVNIRTASPGEYWIKARANGTDSLYASWRHPTFGFTTTSGPLLVTVEQVAATAAYEAEIELAVGQVHEWDLVFRDGNGNTVNNVGAVLSVADSAILAVYGSRSLHARRAGSTFVTATLPGGVGPQAAAEIRVSAREGPAGPRITGWHPEVLVPGSPLVITGEALAGDLSVRIDGALTDVTRRTRDEIEAVVPSVEGCVPRGNAVISVVGREGFGDVAVAGIWTPGDDIEDLAAGAGGAPQQLGSSPRWCVQTDHGGETGYLVVVQGVVSNEAPLRALRSGLPLEGEFTLTSDMHVDRTAPISERGEDAGPPRPAVAFNPTAEAMERRPTGIEADTVLARHREARASLREGVLEALRPLAGLRPLAASRGASERLSRGDTLSFIYNLGRCNDGTPGRGVVKVAGEHVLIVSDVNNSADYSDEAYEELGAVTDDVIVPTLFGYLGPATDVNADGRLVMVFTEHVNRTGEGNILGWVAPSNLLSRKLCPTSNEMEVYFGRVPDPRITEDILEPLLPGLTAHEFAHIIQGRRFLAQNEIVDLGAEIWLMEGQAELSREVVGHAVTGRSPGRNYGADVALGRDGGFTWYRRAFEDFSGYLGSPEGPAACSWWVGNPAPCEGRSLWYGIAWSFLRWLMDQYGPTFPGGEAAINTALLDAPPEGPEFGKIESIIGKEFRELLAGWGAALFLDDRFPAGGVPDSYQFTSWNLRDIFYRMRIEVPVRDVPFEDFATGVSRLRLGSTMYYRLAPAPDAATVGAFELRGRFSGELDEASRSWYGLQAIVVPLPP